MAVEGDRVLGWARLSGYSDRCCYEGVAEVSVYVAREARGRGVGGALVDAVCREAEDQGLWKVIGLLFPENAASVATFESSGFRSVGVFDRHGRLDGRWRDVLVMERALGPAAAGAS